jgi:hypothetical protein
MKSMTKLFLLWLCLVISVRAMAHQDFSITQRYDDVTVRIKTGDHFEEIQRVLISGVLADSLVQQYGYCKPVFIDFEHIYTEEYVSDYFLGYHRGDDYGVQEKSFFQQDSSLVLEVHGSSFCIEDVLKLIEYAILHEEYIIQNQSESTFRSPYHEKVRTTIDTKIIQAQLGKTRSIKVEGLFNIKVDRSDLHPYMPKTGYSYYFHHNRYFVFDLKSREKRFLASFDNIYFFKDFENTVFIFDSDTSFSVLSTMNGNTLSRRHYIPLAAKSFFPVMIDSVANGQYTLEVTWVSSINNNWLYDVRNDKLKLGD